MNTLQIELATPTSLKISWPLFASDIDHEIRRRLATVPGIEVGRGRVAWAPVIQLARLMEIFPRASYEYAALLASDRVAWRFYESLVCLHVKLEIDASGAVVAVGENVSPLIEQLVAERSHALKPFVLEPPTANPLRTATGSGKEQPSIAHNYPKAKRRRAKKRKTA